MKKEKIINDLVYFKDLKIVQNKNYFNFSLDSVLLAQFVKITPKKKRILDLCTGNAPIPIILSTKTKENIIGVEIQKEIYDLAVESVKINNIKNIKILNMDAKKLCDVYETDTFDIITCNPPYFKYEKNSIINDNNIKSIARHEMYINIEDIVKISKKLLKNNGSLYIIQRTNRLIEILELMKKNNLEPKTLQFIYPKENSESNLFLLEVCKNGNVGLKLLNPLIIHNNDGSYNENTLKLFGK